VHMSGQRFNPRPNKGGRKKVKRSFNSEPTGVKTGMRMRNLTFNLAFIILSFIWQCESVSGAEIWDVSCDSLKNMSEAYLRNRWKDRDIDSLVQYIKDGRSLESLTFLKKFPEECDFCEGLDLRGLFLMRIPYFEGYKVQLPHAHLEKSKLLMQNLKNAIFSDAHFEEADLLGSDLSGASCNNAQFVKVKAGGVNFHEADLFNCNFHGAWLVGVDFTNADLNSANLEGALLVSADLSGADLTHTEFKNTFLDNAKLDNANCRNIEWSGYFVGEEQEADILADALKERDAHAKEVRYSQAFRNLFGYSRSINPFISEEIMIQNYKRAKYIYRYLKNIYRSYDLHETAREFHYRENRVATKLTAKPFSWLARKLLFEWTYGYGSRPWRILWSSGIVILAFALGYFIISVLHAESGIYRSDNKPNAPERISPSSLRDFPCVLWNTLYFSLLTFATFGYGSITPQQWVKFFRLEEIEMKPVRWARIIAGFESLVGIYLLALFAKVIFGR
jgi:uncharacterized protein YjbI with pentapeptide repeats